MTEASHVRGDWIWSVLAFYIYSAAVQTMPPPLPGQRWYAWFYNFLQVLGANLKNVFGERQSLVTTTTVHQEQGETVVRKVEEVKAVSKSTDQPPQS